MGAACPGVPGPPCISIFHWEGPGLLQAPKGNEKTLRKSRNGLPSFIKSLSKGPRFPCFLEFGPKHWSSWVDDGRKEVIVLGVGTLLKLDAANHKYGTVVIDFSIEMAEFVFLVTPHHMLVQLLCVPR